MVVVGLVARKKPLGRVLPTAQTRERFYRLVDVRGPDECWPWTGAVLDRREDQHQTYGVWKGFPGTRYVHRIAYCLEQGLAKLDPNIVVHHTCHKNPDHTPLCCNPAHLEPMQGAQHRSMHASDRWQAHKQGQKPFRSPKGMGINATEEESNG